MQYDKIYGEIGSNPDTMNFRKFMKEVENIVNNEENKLFIGSMIAELQFQSNRYSYIKNLEFQGKEYTAEIDELERKFYLIES